MATATIVTDLLTNLITNCDSATADGTWTGVTMAVGTLDPSQLEGAGRLEGIFKSTTDTSNDVFLAPTGGLDLSSEHLRWPLFTVLKSLMKTIANGGIELILSDGTNTAYYAVSGGDIYIGGWESLVLNTGAAVTSGTAPNMAAITSIGMIFRLNAAAKNIDTAFFDYITFGDGFQAIYGGTSGDKIGLIEIAAQDVYYKIFEEIGGVYRVRGELLFGDNISTNVTYFKDPGTVIFFDNLIVSSTLYKIKGVGNTTGATYLDFSGIFISSAGERFLVDFTDINVNEVLLNGTTLQHANAINLCNVVEGSGTIIDDCYAVDPGGATLDGVTVKNTAETTTGSLLVNLQAEAELCTNIIFAGYSNNSRYAVYVAASVTAFTMDNWIFDDPNNTTDIAVHWLGTSGTLTISATNGTNLVTAGCTAETGGTVTVVSAVALTIKGLPSNTEVTIVKVSDRSELYHIENSSGDVVYNYGSGDIGTVVDVLIHHIDYDPHIGSYLDYTLTSGNTAFVVALVVDETYNNPT